MKPGSVSLTSFPHILWESWTLLPTALLPVNRGPYFLLIIAAFILGWPLILISWFIVSWSYVLNFRFNCHNSRTRGTTLALLFSNKIFTIQFTHDFRSTRFYITSVKMLQTKPVCLEHLGWFSCYEGTDSSLETSLSRILILPLVFFLIYIAINNVGSVSSKATIWYPVFDISNVI